MGRNKMIAKSCPKCDMQVAVATKSCKCGHAFFTSRKSNVNNRRSSSPLVSEERRRTGRVRRARPHFYDSQDYQNHRKSKRRSASQGSYDDEDYRGDRPKENTAQRAARRRALKLRLGAESRNTKSSTEQPLPPASLQRCATLLSEINRRMVSVTWVPRDETCVSVDEPQQ